MERNKLAEILEKSLKDDGVTNEVHYPAPPSAPKHLPQRRTFKFAAFEPSSHPPESKPETIETPKFSSNTTEKADVKPPPSQNSAFFNVPSKTTKIVKNTEEEVLDILNEEEFEIDDLGEVWEYAGHSANVNEKEESDTESDEFDPNFVVKVREPTVKNENKVEVKAEEKKVPVKKPQKKKVDLKTRKMQAEAKIQQMEMKEKPIEKKIEDEKVLKEIILEEFNDWENVTIKEIGSFSMENKGEENKSWVEEKKTERIGTFAVDKRPAKKKSFFRRLFSCFHADHRET